MVLVGFMMACTVYSRYVIIPAMDRDLASAGGTIDVADPTNAITADFNRLHNRSERVEMMVLLLGLATVVLVAKAETGRV